MNILRNETYIEKAALHQKPLKTRKATPAKTVEFIEDSASFQHIKVVEKGAFSLPVTLKSGDRILLDFGEHHVGIIWRRLMLAA